MKQTIKIPVVAVIMTIIMLFSSCTQRYKDQSDYYITSSLETLSKDKKNFLADTDNSYSFKGGNLQTMIQKRSGDFSALTTPKSAYTLSIELPQIKRDSYVEASVWRKGELGHFVAVITGSKGYIATKEAVETDSNGWSKLSLMFYIPPVKDGNYGF